MIAASAISILAILGFQSLISITFWIFAAIFIVDLLKATAEQGYTNILFSSTKNKIILRETYSNTRKFILKLRASGIPGILRLSVLLIIIILYPILLSFGTSFPWMLSDNGIIIFIFSCSFIALLQIKPLLTRAFDSRKEIERTLQTENEEKAELLEDKQQAWNAEKRTVEEKIISERLESIGVVPYYIVQELNSKPRWTSRDLRERGTPVLMDPINVKIYGSIHLNIIIHYLNSDSETRGYIYLWTKNILCVLAKSKSEVKHYSVSFFRNEGGPTHTHFAIFRASRDKVMRSLSKSLNNEEFIRSLPSKYLTDAVAEY